MIPRILIIDDEPMPSRLYKEALENNHCQVEMAETTDEAMRQLENNGRFDLVILDCMMPPGEVLKEEQTDDGMRSGIVLWNKIRDTAPMTPAMFLTNVRVPELLNEMWDLAGRRRVRQKGRTPPSMLVQEVKEMFASEQS
jgi:CheY-like chemotaxis protein